LDASARVFEKLGYWSQLFDSGDSSGGRRLPYEFQEPVGGVVRAFAVVLREHGYQRVQPANLLKLEDALSSNVTVRLDKYGDMDVRLHKLRAELKGAREAQGKAQARELWAGSSDS
jgi:hypothetical protein